MARSTGFLNTYPGFGTSSSRDTIGGIGAENPNERIVSTATASQFARIAQPLLLTAGPLQSRILRGIAFKTWD